ncbi:MAG: isoprenylcysteine carboxylmethyltransferase family protein [Anaerolineales bacterium]|nr:isoprenylcysteine carboxylmethyltransferase family protein [Anaerolineales bacterium]
MDQETVFRGILLLSVVVIGAVRIYYQSKISRDTGKFHFREGPVTLALAGTAALVNIVFGAEYVFFPGTFAFAYALRFPAAVRWTGAAMLVLGIAVLWLAHHHLGLSFSSFVGSKELHALVQSGPYRIIRHPIYTAYLLMYLGGGLAAGNWVLVVIPVTCFFLNACLRMPQEERILTELFGPEYTAYMQRTGRLLPRLR